MKAFTTLDHITPILQEITANYTPIYNPPASMDCIILLQKNGSRDALAIRENGPFYITCKAMTALYKQIETYTEAAETYPGELHTWSIDEKHRAQTATRDAIIKHYTTA